MELFEIANPLYFSAYIIHRTYKVVNFLQNVEELITFFVLEVHTKPFSSFYEGYNSVKLAKLN